ncbi:MAG: hypothetical protein AAF146_16505, partial [Bacteroidota bacterium]
MDRLGLEINRIILGLFVGSEPMLIIYTLCNQHATKGFFLQKEPRQRFGPLSVTGNRGGLG